jgi:SAM-dependent methyltransferase
MKRENPCPICGNWEVDVRYLLPEGKYVKCKFCGLVGVDPLPSSSFIYQRSVMWSELHHTNPEKVEQHYSDHFQEIAFKQHLDRLQQYRVNERLLDVGCGIGGFVDAARKWNWESYGIDISPSVKIGLDRGLNIRQCTLNNLDLPENYFDVITMFDVIEHIANLNELMVGIQKFLRPGGGLFVVTPNLNSISSRILKSKWVAIEPEDHFTLFAPDTLGNLLRKYRFDVTRIVTQDIFILGYKDMFSPRSSLRKRKQRQASSRKLIRMFVASPVLLRLRQVSNYFLNLMRLGERLLMEARFID